MSKQNWVPSVNAACYQYGLCVEYLPVRKKDGYISSELEKRFRETASKFRPLLCKKLGLPNNTKWKRLLSTCGLLLEDKLPKEEERKRFTQTNNLLLGGKEVRLYGTLDEIRCRITGRI